jgi:hypothetical protein
MSLSLYTISVITGFAATDTTDILPTLIKIIHSAGFISFTMSMLTKMVYVNAGCILVIGITTTSIFTMAVITWLTTGTISTIIA